MNSIHRFRNRALKRSKILRNICAKLLLESGNVFTAPRACALVLPEARDVNTDVIGDVSGFAYTERV